MVACRKTRLTSNVTIGIQPEEGERIMREFPPKTTLAQTLLEIYPDSDLERAVLIYMHREVCVYIYKCICIEKIDILQSIIKCKSRACREKKEKYI